MRRIRTSMVLVLFVTAFMVFFYLGLHSSPSSSSSNSPSSPSSSSNSPSSPSSNSSSLSSSPPSSLSSSSSSVPQPAVQNVSVSEGFRQTMVQNQVYWSRLLNSALMTLDGGETPSGLESGSSDCRVPNQELRHAGLYDVESYPDLFRDFVQGMTCRSPRVLLDQPNKCVSAGGEDQDQNQNHTFLLFAIKSTPTHFEQRQAVRETWARERVYPGGLRVRTVFLLGTSPPEDPDLSPLLSAEADHYGDLVQWDFHESLFNLTLKMHLFLRWTGTRCPDARFVFSGDDDVFVNTPGLLGYLQSVEPAKASRLYVGHVIGNAAPYRDPGVKYYIPESFYRGAYPPYAGGGGFVVSGALLWPLRALSHVVPFFPIDDVYVGMCCLAAGVSPEPHGGFHTFDVMTQDRDNLCVHKYLVMVHQRSPRQLRRLWRGVNDPALAC